MDAAGSSRAVLPGISEGGAMTELFAATCPKGKRPYLDGFLFECEDFDPVL